LTDKPQPLPIERRKQMVAIRGFVRLQQANAYIMTDGIGTDLFQPRQFLNFHRASSKGNDRIMARLNLRATLRSTSDLNLMNFYKLTIRHHYQPHRLDHKLTVAAATSFLTKCNSYTAEDFLLLFRAAIFLKLMRLHAHHPPTLLLFDWCLHYVIAGRF